jgi:hypothetical protein
MPKRAFKVWIKSHPDESEIVYADTIGKAKYSAFLDWQEPCPDLDYRDMRAKSLGFIETPKERMTRQVDAFNDRFPVGTPVRVYPGPMGDHESAYDTVVKKPGAFILSGHCVAVKVPGDSILITHVVPLMPLNQPVGQEAAAE